MVIWWTTLSECSISEKGYTISNQLTGCELTVVFLIRWGFFDRRRRIEELQNQVCVESLLDRAHVENSPHIEMHANGDSLARDQVASP